MDNICQNCGEKLAEGTKFCASCGKEVNNQTENKTLNANEEEAEKEIDAKDKSTLNQSNNTNKLEKLAQSGAINELKTSFANPSAGEVMSGEFGNLSRGATDVLGPLGTVVSQSKNVFKNSVGIIKNKEWKKLIMIGVLAVVWIVLMILSYKGMNIGILNWLTFAMGGMGRNIFGMIGGVLGKFTLATALFSLINGGYKSLGSGFKSLIKRDNFKTNNLGWLLAGAGCALIIYQYFAGNAYWTDTMSAISGGLLGVMAIGSGSGFIFKISQSITSSKNGKVRTPQNQKANSLLTGLTYGFVLGALVSLIPFGWLPIIIGGACLISGVVLIFIIKDNKNNQKEDVAI